MESFLAESFAAVGNGAGCGTGREDPVDARRAHFVVAFWVDEELEGGVEVAVRFADGADVVGGIIIEGFGPVAHHDCGRMGSCGDRGCSSEP